MSWELGSLFVLAIASAAMAVVAVRAWAGAPVPETAGERQGLAV